MSVTGLNGRSMGPSRAELLGQNQYLVARNLRNDGFAYVREAVAGDIEPGWDRPPISRALVRGAATHDMRYFNFGDAGGCPPEPNPGGCKNNWDRKDLGYVSQHANAEVLPQIYKAFNPKQWMRVARSWDRRNCPEYSQSPRRTCFFFTGATSQPKSCPTDFSPRQSWRRLHNKAGRRTVRRHLLYWNPDGCG